MKFFIVNNHEMSFFLLSADSSLEQKCHSDMTITKEVVIEKKNGAQNDIHICRSEKLLIKIPSEM